MLLGASGSSEVSTGFFSKTIDQSLRFDEASSSCLERTPDESGNRRTWSFSCWIKRANLTASGKGQSIFSAGTNVYNRRVDLDIGANHELTFFMDGRADGASYYALISSSHLRDVSSWYHIMAVMDTTDSTSDDRLKLYINGTRDTGAYQYGHGAPPEDSDWYVNHTNAHDIGNGHHDSVSQFFDGYMAEVHHVDGTALDPSSFGETKDGIWVPKAYSGSHGTNGFYLPFDDSSAIGDDESANTNDFTPSNLAATDVVPDSPTNNFATLNPLVVSGGSPTLSEGNLKLVGSGTDYDTSYATIAVTSGKWYAEFLYVSGDNRGMFGVVREDRLYYVNGSAYIGSIDDTYGIDFRARSYTGTSATSSSGSELFDATDFDTGDIGLLCFDVDNGKLWFGRRDVSGSTTIWYDSSGNNNGDPSAGSNPTWTFTATGSTWFIGCHDYNGTTIIANFGQDGSFSNSLTSQGASDAGGIGDFNYIESGFLALCTSNMPDITIGPGQDTQADDHFNTVLYTGTGSNISVSGVGFSPNWVWLKSRSLAYDNMIFDTVRGTNKILKSNGAAAEITSVSTTLLSFDSDGFTYGTEASVNTASSTNVGWNWKGGGSANTFNVDGTGYGSASDASLSGGNITPTGASVNTTAGFSIIGYTGNGSAGQTIKHGLSSAPEFIIIKDRVANSNNNQWQISHTPFGDDYGYFTADAFAGVAQMVPTSGDATTNTIGIDGTVLTNESGDDFIMYSFHSVEGYSKVGTYTGNAAADGAFVYTGFRPAFVLIKGGTNNWSMYDNKRDIDNVVSEYLIPNNSDAAGTAATMDFVSNGFKLRTSGSYANQATKFLFLAIAEAPFKFANAR